ncbi:hypothetical protein SESBI_40587 [Sesbania bispinosa]|nr:hypothetical protein SESBI_40587 [Sesbania bispinosa]
MAMVLTGYHAIKNLCGRRERWRLKVKVVRIWNNCALATPDEPFAIQMVLLDEDGDTIEGTVLKQNMRRFANVMVEGQVYKLMNFGVMLSKGLPVVIFQLARVKLYRGEVRIQNVMNATKIWWNPDIAEALEFKNSLAVHKIETDMAISIISDTCRPVSKRDEFLNLYPKKNIGQLHELVEEGFFIILGTIKEIVDDELWLYMACSYMRAVNYGRGYPYCDYCHCVVYDMTPRYKVKILVSDGDDSAHLLMWDSECYSLLNKSYRDLLADTKGDESGSYPEEMLNWLDKEMFFRIERKEDSTFGYDDSFKVRRICCDTALISDFKAIVHEDTPLKLKFAPPFAKDRPSEGTSCVIDISPHGNSSVSPLDVSPVSIAKPSSSAEGCSVLSKRSRDTTPDEGIGRRKLPRNRILKVEKP